MNFNAEELIETVGGDKEIAAEVVQVYIEEAKELIDGIETEIGNNNAEKVDVLGHTLKGASSNLGAESICEKALQIEQAGKAGDLKLATELLPQLKAAYELLIKELQDWLQE
ncbi:MAG: Hpt domain-containing protein [Fibrobacteria bacterium]|nr:Hpt domain-containing protein [Fibrobacteria bacterium]